MARETEKKNPLERVELCGGRVVVQYADQGWDTEKTVVVLVDGKETACNLADFDTQACESIEDTASMLRAVIGVAEESHEDTKILDWLGRAGSVLGFPLEWRYDEHGLRRTIDTPNFPTAREAIRAAMAEGGGQFS